MCCARLELCVSWGLFFRESVQECNNRARYTTLRAKSNTCWLQGERECALRSYAVQGVRRQAAHSPRARFAWRSHSPDSGVSNGTFRCRPRGSGCPRITQSTKRTCAPAVHSCPRQLSNGSRAQRPISVGAGRRREARRREAARSAAFLRTGGVVERLVVEVEGRGNVHLDLNGAGLDCGARSIHRSEKGARRKGEKSNEKRTEHCSWKSRRSSPQDFLTNLVRQIRLCYRQDLSLRSSSIGSRSSIDEMHAVHSQYCLYLN